MKTYSHLDDALRLAAKLHSGQRRDGEFGLPYAVHPYEVVSNLRYIGGVVDETVLTAAALHDALEKTEIEASQIREKFGKKVAELVKELTRQEPNHRETKALSDEEVWQMRSGLLLGEIAKMSVNARSIKLADRLSNVREALVCLNGEDLERYRVQTYEILETIPREVNPPLWDSVKTELSRPVGSKTEIAP
jgi:(p)ppGpp synthase/HD superfamily hydrolase